MADVSVAIIGCGRVTGRHCSSIAMTPGVSLAAVCDLIPEKAQAYSQKFGVPQFTSYHDMMRAVPGIDVVAVITPSGMHFEHAVEIMRLYKKSVLVEKPTFMRPSQLVDAYAVADRLGVNLFPIFQNRYNRAVERVRRGVRDGELGPIRIVAVRVRWCRPQRYYDMSRWRGTYAQDGGCLTNQGVHHVDLLRHLGGPITQVSACMRTIGAKIEVEDVAVGMVSYTSGAVGVVEVTTAARPDDFEASISFVCERGLAQIGGIAVNELQIFTPDPAECREWTEDFGGDVYGHGHEQIYRDVVAAFAGQAYPITREDALATLKLLHGFYRSDEQDGNWVSVNDDAESERLGRPDEALADVYRTPPV